MRLPRVGEEELPQAKMRDSGGHPGRRRFVHTSVQAAKPLDKKSLGYERKLRQSLKKDPAERSEPPRQKGKPDTKGKRRRDGKSYGKVRSEIKTVDQIRKSRELQSRRKDKNARHTGKTGKRGRR